MISDNNQVINQIFQTIKILSKFSENSKKRLNFINLCNFFQISVLEGHILIKIILKFQKLFNGPLANLTISIENEGDNLYLKATQKNLETVIPKKIKISRKQLRLLSDATYTFLKVRRGQGFDLVDGMTQLSRDLSKLKSMHKYLFFQKENGLWYFSEFALELGKTVRMYNESKIAYQELIVNSVKVEALD